MFLKKQKLLKEYFQSFHTKISHLQEKKVGDITKIEGWIQRIRRMKNQLFIDVSDGTSVTDFQIVVPKEILPKETSFSVGQSVQFDGILQESPKKNLELNAQKFKIYGSCNISDGNYPFTFKQIHNPEYVRNYLHFRAQIGYMRSIFRIRSQVCRILHDFMAENDFIEIHTPIITGNDCEGAGEVFFVRPENDNLLQQMRKENFKIEESYFDQKTYLSVSGQLHLEAMCHGLGNCYTLSPAFRAENSKSPIHLSEFYMFEAELAFCSKISDLCYFIEKMLKAITERTLEKCEKDIHNCNEIKEENFNWLKTSFTTITYKEAIDILRKAESKLKNKEVMNDGLSKEQELYLVNYCRSPVFVVEWPKKMKPFYMRQLDADPNMVNGLDLLMPGLGELVGGSLRENNYDNLRQNNIPKHLEWYLELRKYGSIPTAGFGLGFERYLQLITGVKNIRDVIPFPRYPHSCKM